MKINMIHLRERSTSGNWINFAVFDAKSTSGDNDQLLYQLTQAARADGLPVDQSALAFQAEGKVRFYGDRYLVSYLTHGWIPDWNRTIDLKP